MKTGKGNRSYAIIVGSRATLHLAALLYRVALYTALERAKQDIDHLREELEATPPILINCEVNETKVRDILVDTRTSTTIVRGDVDGRRSISLSNAPMESHSSIPWQGYWLDWQGSHTP